MQPRIACYGRPGAGKSTFTAALAREFEDAGQPAAVLKIGAPLYELQGHVYLAAGHPAPAAGQQDGALLNTLASHLRRINPSCLTDSFARAVARREMDEPGVVVLCDDLRAPDVDALAGLGFRFVQVWAPDDLRALRKAGRGDLSAGDETHESEREIAITPHFRVENTGSLEMLRARAAEVASAVTG
ncbi:hypothetical protein OG455_27435 [Kitasatospora sp. NBC_01287]|uniref:hypothetical protein n=1 Tax=Kitasatospora sp. NBC_01287 TaxID=2903573 RepID=UPI002255199F|nr:hypothetical protein [Kitasatospora sp. NBC_01287]MCX4749193.1 hypothetical protein [Kitasatospora sp. NBC_01287]